MAFIMRNAAGKLLIVAVCGIGGAPSCGSHQLRREYPLPPLTQTPIRHPNPPPPRRRPPACGTIGPAMASETTTLDPALAERERVLRILREEAPRLRALGITRLSLFGSMARGEA